MSLPELSSRVMPPHHRRTPAQRLRRQRERGKVDPIQLGRLLKQRKAAGLIIALVIIVAIALLDRGAGLLPVDDDWHKYHQKTFKVMRVVDGDTLDLSVADGDHATTRIRLWGVDTEEMNFNDPDTPPDPWAQEATDFTRRLTEGQRVTLHLQAHELRDSYGRLLAYVELPDGRFLNAALIEVGLSEHDDRWGHDHADDYEALELQAQRNGQGKWAP